MKQEDYERAVEIEKQIKELKEEIDTLTPAYRRGLDVYAGRELELPSRKVKPRDWESNRKEITLTDDDLEILRNRRHYTMYELEKEFDELGCDA